MALKAILDTLDGLPEDVAKEYEQKGDKFFLIVEDDIRQHPKVKALQVAFERNRDGLKEAKDKLAEVEAKLAEYPPDFNAEQHAADMDELDTLRKKKKKGEGEPDPEVARQKALLEQRITTLTANHAKEKKDLETERDGLIKEIERLVADEGLTKALVAVGVEKKLMPGATALLRKSVKVSHNKDLNEWRGYFETDLGESSIEDYVATWAQSDEGSIYIAKAKGGGSNGGGDRQQITDNPWDASNGKKPNLTRQQEIMKTNPDKARQLAQAAGVTLPATF